MKIKKYSSQDRLVLLVPGLLITLHQMGASVYGISLEPNTSPSIFKLLNLEEK